MDDHQFHRLLAHFGFSREGYRRVRKGVKKRLRRHMQALGCQGMASYLDAIESDPRRRSECLRRLSVPISRFMRDAEFWETLKTRILPDLAARWGGRLSVWSAGCACGEEAYSLAITAHMAACSNPGDPPTLNILATDRNPANLARAREGIYPRSSLREVASAQLDRHFIALRGGRSHRIRPERQGQISWLCCDIEKLPIVGLFHAVLLRNNVLTYMERPGQKQALLRVRRHLRPGGVLVVGRRERLPGAVDGLIPRYGLSYVFEHRWA